MHLACAEDYWWLHPLTTPQLRAGNARRLAQEGVPLAADRSHRRNYHDFMAHGGLPPLLAAQGLSVDQRRVVAGGAIGLYLAGIHGPDGTTPRP